MNEPIICFIDDSDFEHDLVRNEIAPSAPGFSFLQTYTFEEAKKDLGNRIPILFLLDLWGQDPDVNQPYMTPKKELEMRIAGFKSLEDVYDGLISFQNDKEKEFLMRLFAVVDDWRKLFEDVCNRIGQNRKYGIGNINKVRDRYPGVSAVFYTRKSLIGDAVAMFQAGADGLFIKPTGQDEEETRILTRRFARELIENLTQIIRQNRERLMNCEGFYSSKNADWKNLTKGLESL